jgi:citrate lyase beta subunit
VQSLEESDTARLLAPLAEVDRRLAATYPGGVPVQPAHTCYVPADRLRVGESRLWGEQARALLAEHAPTAEALEQALGRSLPPETHDDVVRLLRTHPVHDLRVDLEDGYGRRADDEEDAAVDAALAALAAEPPRGSYGVRIKALEAGAAERSARTLDRWLTGLAALGLPPGIVTLPKVQASEQVAVAVALLEELEARTGVGRVALELQVETAAAVVDASGRVAVPLLLAAGRGRVTGLHFGTYDYTAALGLSPREQSLDAPVADAAKDLMQLSAAATGVAVSDGSSNVLPVGDHAQVHAAWALHGRLVERATARGLWQGWDLHPGQLVSRWATVSAFLRERLPEAQARLAGRVPGVADEPATMRMLQALQVRASALGLDTPLQQ